MNRTREPDGEATTQLSVVIADDEPLVRSEIRSLLASEEDIVVEAEYRDGMEAVEGIAALRPDVALLDIRMPGLTGLEVAEALSRNIEAAHRPIIVFITAYDKHAVQAFDMDAADYLLKPVDEARFRQTLERVRRQHRQGQLALEAARLDKTIERLRAGQAPEARRYAERLVVQAAGTLRVIPLDAVHWIEADDNYARVHTSAAAPLLRETLKSLEARLDPARFVRVHRSAIVRIDLVRELKPQPSGDYQLRLESGARVPMSRGYRDAVLARLGRSEPGGAL